jgi:hypothetical protein
VQKLKILDGVFDIDQAAPAVFRIQRPRCHEFINLALAERHGSLQVERRRTIHELIPPRFDAPTQRFRSRHPAQFDECLTLKRRG